MRRWDPRARQLAPLKPLAQPARVGAIGLRAPLATAQGARILPRLSRAGPVNHSCHLFGGWLGCVSGVGSWLRRGLLMLRRTRSALDAALALYGAVDRDDRHAVLAL